MVLESLISPQNAERHPKEMLLFGAAYSFIAAFIALWVFADYASIVMVFLTTMAASPLIYKIIRLEEKKDTQGFSEQNLLREHSKALKSFMYLFLGVTIMLSFIYMIIPEEKATTLFEAQSKTITQINGKATENITSSSVLMKIFLNNVRVLIFCILFSFLYGIGALFILTWNASIIAVALGGFIKEQLVLRSAEIGVLGITHYFGSVSMGILR